MPASCRRIIIPGYIGGRMVKWLSEISVTKEESTNYYHFFDNRVLPSHVDEKLALEEGEQRSSSAAATFAC
jgi:nitrate reductase (NAD(P)H)